MYSSSLASGSIVNVDHAPVAVKAAAAPNHLHEPSLRPFAPLSEQLTKSGQPRRRRRRLDVYEMNPSPTTTLASPLVASSYTPSSMDVLASTSSTALSSADP